MDQEFDIKYRIITNPDKAKFDKCASTFAFEGLDGTGKETMSDMLKKYLKDNNKRAVKISFPRYESPASYCAQQWIKRNYTDEDFIDWRSICSMYYIDMLDWSASEYYLYMINNYSIVFDRWIFSNMIYQCINGDSYKYDPNYAKEAQIRIDTIYNMAINDFSLFAPEELIITYLPLEVSMKNLEKKHNEEDKNETYDMQKKAALGLECFLDWLPKNAENVHIIDMSDGKGNMDTAESNFAKVIKALKLD